MLLGEVKAASTSSVTEDAVGAAKYHYHISCMTSLIAVAEGVAFPLFGL